MKKKFWFVFVLILIVSYGFAFGDDDAKGDNNVKTEIPKKAIKLVKKGEDALKKNEFDKALEAYEKAIAMAPEYGAAYFGKGRLLLMQKKNAEAILSLEKAVQLVPDSAKLKQFYAQNLWQLSNEFLKKKQVKQSNDYLLKLIEIPDIQTVDKNIFHNAMLQLGNNNLMIRNSNEANKYFMKFLNLPGIEEADKKMVIQATYRVGTIFHSQRKFKEAVEYFLKLFDYPEFKADFGSLYLATLYMVGLDSNYAGDFQRSIEFLSKFIEEGKDSPENKQFMPLANFLIGSAHMTLLKKEIDKIEDKDKMKKAAELAASKSVIETYFKAAIELKPDLEPAYMQLGNFYYYSNNLKKSLETYNTLIEKFPNSNEIEQYKKFIADIKSSQKKKKKK